jgi:glycogen(starch) synthase
LKILHLIYDHMNNPWVGGGGAVRAYELSKRLAQRGHSITVISGRYPGAKDYDEGGLCYKFVGSDGNYVLSTFSYALQAARYVRRHGGDFDVVVEEYAPWNPVFSRFMTRT